jgi:hypothetical protein
MSKKSIIFLMSHRHKVLDTVFVFLLLIEAIDRAINLSLQTTETTKEWPNGGYSCARSSPLSSRSFCAVSGDGIGNWALQQAEGGGVLCNKARPAICPSHLLNPTIQSVFSLSNKFALWQNFSYQIAYHLN